MIRRWANDPRLWTTGILIGLLAVANWTANRFAPLLVPLSAAFQRGDPRALDLEELPPALGKRIEEDELRALAARVSAADAGVPAPFSGRPILPQRVGQFEDVLLPDGLGPRLSALLIHDVRTVALGALRDPANRLDDAPLRDAVARRIGQGFTRELESLGQLIANQPPWTARPRVLVQGRGRVRLGGAVGPQVETQVYGAWLDRMSAWYDEHDIPWVRWRSGYESGAWRVASDVSRAAYGKQRSWHPDWYDLDAHLDALSTGQITDDGPFVELGRLRALELMTRAHQVELVFAGHGKPIKEPETDEARFAGYALRPLQTGDGCQELVILRSDKGKPRLRLGLCLGQSDPQLVLSCSNAWAGNSALQHHMAGVRAWLIGGTMPPFDLLEPPGFRLYPTMQEMFRQEPLDITGAMDAMLSEPVSPPHTDITAIIKLAKGAWLVRVGDAASPDLLLAAPELDHVDDVLDEQLAAATTTWRRVEPASRRAPAQAREFVLPCGGQVDCEDTLEALRPALRGPLPVHPADAFPIELDDRPIHLIAVPDATQPWIRIAVIPAHDETAADLRARAERIRAGVRARRVQSVMVSSASPHAGAAAGATEEVPP